MSPIITHQVEEGINITHTTLYVIKNITIIFQFDRIIGHLQIKRFQYLLLSVERKKARKFLF